MADFTTLKQKLTDLTSTVNSAVTVEGSAVALINGQADASKAAIAKALADNDAVDQAMIDQINGAVDSVRDSMVSSSSALATAVTNNTPAGTPAPEPPPVG